MKIDKVAVVGAGSAGSRHAMVASELLPRSDVRLFPSREVAASGSESLLRFAPQIVVIANPATQHMAVADRVARLDAHVLFEKPLAAGMDEVEGLSDRSPRGQVVMVGYNLRFFRSLSLFREVIRSGRIGRVMSVRAEVGQYLPTWRPQDDYRTSVSARRALGGGVLLELSHEFDYLRWVFGDLDWVSCVSSTVSDLEIDVEDVALLTMMTKPDAVAASAPISLAMDFIRHDRTRYCLAIGTRGSAKWDATLGEVSSYEPENSVWRSLGAFESEGPASYVSEWEAFLAAIRDGQASPIPLEDGLATLRVVDAARRSSRSGERVTVLAPD